MLANSEATNAAFSDPWPDLFSKTGSPGDKVGGFSLPLLRKECLAWFESTLSRPSGVNNQSAIGDEDHAFATAILQGDDFEVEQKRNSVIAKLDELLRKKTAISFIPNSQYTGLAFTRALAGVRQSCAEILKKNNKVMTSTSKEGTLFLCSAELFLGHGQIHHPGQSALKLLAPTHPRMI